MPEGQENTCSKGELPLLLLTICTFNAKLSISL
jgi:hypothetical protein